MSSSRFLKKSTSLLCLMVAVSAFAGETVASFSEMAAAPDAAVVLPAIESAKAVAVAQPGLAALTYFNSRASFDAAAPDITLEDFEGGVVGPGQLVGCGSPVSAAPSPCFPAGIASGLEVHASSGTNIVALGSGIVPVHPTTWVGSDLFNDVTSLEFTNGDTYAVGLDVFDFFGTPTLTISVYGAGGLIGTSLAISGGFWGVVADEPIVRVVLGTNTNVVVLDNVAFGNPIVDTDGDGLPDDVDACPVSDLSATVVIGGCDSGVANGLLDSGCTLNDLIAACAEGADNHGAFVACVAHLTNQLKDDGLITGREKGAIQRCAARAGK